MNVPLYGDEYRKVFGNLATLCPSAHEEPNMTVKISAGGFWSWLEGTATYVEYPGGSSPAISAPASNAKWVVVAMTPTGLVVNIDGTPGVNPTLPTIPANRYPIALVYVQSTTTSLTNDDIFDARPIFSNPVRSHADLSGNTDSGCHTIGAITDLADTLSGLAPSADVISRLLLKADVGGTPSTSFKMNQSHSGVPSSDIYFEVERGSSNNVAIRWNETTEEWEYTNDGSTYYTLSGAYRNDGSQDIVLKVYEQTSEPALSADYQAAIWIDTDDSNRVYLIFRRGSGDQVKVELT